MTEKVRSNSREMGLSTNYREFRRIELKLAGPIAQRCKYK